MMNLVANRIIRMYWSKKYEKMINTSSDEEMLALREKYLKKNKNVVIRSFCNGWELNCYFDNLLPYYEKKYKHFNKPLCYAARYLESVLGRPINVVDVGANIGDTVLCIGNPKSYYICVEGVSQYADLLRKNLSSFHFDLEETFISDDDAQLSICNSSSGTAQVEKCEDVGVESHRLDDILNEKYGSITIDLIKVDTDGYDFSVIRSAKNTIQEYKPVLYFEWEFKYLNMNGEDVYSIFALLNSMGYSRILLFDHTGEVLFPIHTIDYSTLEKCLDWTCKDHYIDENRRINYFDVLCFHSDSKLSYEDFMLKWYI